MSLSNFARFAMILVTICATSAASGQTRAIGGSVTAKRFVVHPAEVVEATSDLVVEAEEIIIDGAIVGGTGNDQSTGVSITLRASREIIIRGETKAGDGGGPMWPTMGVGGVGGTLVLIAPSITLDGPDRIEGAAGGNGAIGGYDGAGVPTYSYMAKSAWQVAKEHLALWAGVEETADWGISAAGTVLIAVTEVKAAMEVTQQ